MTMSPSALKVYFDFIIFNFIVKNILPVKKLKKENIKNNTSVDCAEESCTKKMTKITKTETAL